MDCAHHVNQFLWPGEYKTLISFGLGQSPGVVKRNQLQRKQVARGWGENNFWREVEKGHHRSRNDADSNSNLCPFI